MGLGEKEEEKNLHRPMVFLIFFKIFIFFRRSLTPWQRSDKLIPSGSLGIADTPIGGLGNTFGNNTGTTMELTRPYWNGRMGPRTPRGGRQARTETELKNE